MFIINLFRRILGYITFCASGGFSERFINLCAFQGIDIRNIEFDGSTLTADTKIKNYKKLRHIARKSGMKIRAVKKHGLPFFLNRHKNRVGLAVGGVFFVIFMSIMPLFVWSVETVGAQNISSEEILSVVSELGLKTGAFTSSVDETEVARLAMMKLSGKLSWLAVNIKGSRAVVEARDYEKRPDDKTYGDPCNIVADFDGLILSMDVYNGKKANYEGGGVRKGDLLISGIVENRDTSAQFLEARGEIVALHSDRLVKETAVQSNVKVYNKVKTVKSLRFFFLKIPFGIFQKGGEYDTYKSEKYLTYNDFKLPFGIESETRSYYETKKITYPGAAAVAFDNYINESREKYKNTLITDSKIKVSSKDGAISISSENECIDFIGEKQKIEMREEP